MKFTQAFDIHEKYCDCGQIVIIIITYHYF